MSLSGLYSILRFGYCNAQFLCGFGLVIPVLVSLICAPHQHSRALVALTKEHARQNCSRFWLVQLVMLITQVVYDHRALMVGATLDYTRDLNWKQLSYKPCASPVQTYWPELCLLTWLWLQLGPIHWFYGITTSNTMVKLNVTCLW